MTLCRCKWVWCWSSRTWRTRSTCHSTENGSTVGRSRFWFRFHHSFKSDKL